MPDQANPLSTDQRVDAFTRAIGVALRRIAGISSDSLPADLPTPVKPTASHPENGATSDQSD